MFSPFVCGVLAAWALAKLALGAFFLLTYAYRRREAEFLLFGVLCFAMAIFTSGISLMYHADTPEGFYPAAEIAHLGAITAGALNLHFTIAYTRRPRSLRLLFVVYALVAFHIGCVLTDSWWVPGTTAVRVAKVFGTEVAHVSSDPTFYGWSFYVVAFAELVLATTMLVRAVRGGQREAGWALVGAVAISLAGLNDMLTVSGVLSSVYLAPHAFLVYAFVVATTLPLRYQSAERELEATTVDLAQATEELRNSYVELQVVQEQLTDKQQMAQVGELAAAIAHEVRNPLAIIVNACASLKRPNLDESDRGMLLGIIEEEAARLNRLVTDLLRFARPVKVKRVEVPLEELLERARTRVDRDHELELEIEDDPEVKTLWADPGLLPLVFENLVSNACQSMRDGGTVRVVARRAPPHLLPQAHHQPLWAARDYVAVEIRDDGHGMDDDVMNRATDPFFTTRPSGTGLGLPIVDRIVSAHGGRLDISSVRGEGTTVAVILPMGEQPESEDEALPGHLRTLLDGSRQES